MEESLFADYETVSLWWQIRTAEKTWWDKFALQDPFGEVTDPLQEEDGADLDLFIAPEIE